MVKKSKKKIALSDSFIIASFILFILFISLLIIFNPFSAKQKITYLSEAASCSTALSKDFLTLNLTNSKCISCLYKAADLANSYKRDNPKALTNCSESELVNYWCNGGWGTEGKQDCETKKKSTYYCSSSCAGVSASPTPTKSVTKPSPTVTPKPTKSSSPFYDKPIKVH